MSSAYIMKLKARFYDVITDGKLRTLENTVNTNECTVREEDFFLHLNAIH